MSLFRRFSSLLVLLAGLAFLTAGCGGPPVSTVANLPDVVIVVVDYDSASGRATVTPKEIRLKELKQFVRWISCDGTVEVEFDSNDTPFDTPPGLMKKATDSPRSARTSEAAGAAAIVKHQLNSGKPRAGSARTKPYEYKVFLVLPDGRKILADPRIIVDP